MAKLEKDPPKTNNVDTNSLSTDPETIEEGMDNTHGGRGKDSYKETLLVVPTDQIIVNYDEEEY